MNGDEMNVVVLLLECILFQIDADSIHGRMCDARDGHIYKTIVMNDAVWMAENLSYVMPHSKCPMNDSSSCSEFGRIYDWHSAMNACPNGWHLPSIDEWKKLSLKFSPSELKSKKYWREDCGQTPGTDRYGFSALPVGLMLRCDCNGDSMHLYPMIGCLAQFWTSKDSLPVIDKYGVYEIAFFVQIWFDELTLRKGNRDRLFSIRCIKN